MEGFGLLCGHLLGDFILQNDWMAKNKTSQPGLPYLSPAARKLLHQEGGCRGYSPEVHKELADWELAFKRHIIGHLSCTVHCFIYTLSIWAFSFWWLPWWGLLVCFLAHWPIDRFRLAACWMKRIAGQKEFATGALAPWSVIVVDNTFHLLTLFFIAGLAGR